MKITDYRDPQGRFARKQRRRKNIKIVILLIVIAIIVILYNLAQGQNLEPWQVNEEQPAAITDAFKNDVDSVMNRANFKERMRNQAAQIYVDEQIKSENKRHEEELTRLEAMSENLKKEELSLQ